MGFGARVCSASSSSSTVQMARMPLAKSTVSAFVSSVPPARVLALPFEVSNGATLMLIWASVTAMPPDAGIFSSLLQAESKSAA